MAERVSSRRRPRRKIACRSDGSMFDVAQHRAISIEELRDLLAGGENFEAESEETGRDCTFEVLRRVMGGGAPGSKAGPADLSLPGLRGLGRFTDLIGLARLAGDRIKALDLEDELNPRRSRHRAPPPDWADEGSA